MMAKKKRHVLGRGYIWFAKTNKETSWPDSVQLTKRRVPVSPEEIVRIEVGELGNWCKGTLVFETDVKEKKADGR
jgi:hypothetical protein